LAAGYLLIVLGHLFPAPNFGVLGRGDNYLQKISRNKSTQLIYNLIRTNRCRADESKTINTQQKGGSGIQPRVSLGHTMLAIPKRDAFSYVFSPDRHFSYLNNRVLRI
jgi:hypothetical protein